VSFVAAEQNTSLHFHSIYNHVELQGVQLLIMCTHSLPDMYACPQTDILAYTDVIIIILFPKNQNQPWDRVGYGEFSWVP